MDSGLHVLRRINPPRDLREWLEVMGQLEEIEDKQGKAHFYVDDRTPRPLEITEEIVNGHGVTVNFTLFDADNNAHYVTTRADKAEQALRGAKVTVTPIIDVEELPEAEPEDEGPDLPPVKVRH